MSYNLPINNNQKLAIIVAMIPCLAAPSVLFDLRFWIEDGDSESSLSFLLVPGDSVRDTNLSSVPALEALGLAFLVGLADTLGFSEEDC